MEPLTAAEQRQLDQRVNQLQVKQFIHFFGGVVENCFSSCVDEFTTKTISNRESSCISRCVQKSIASQQRLRDRFDEHQAGLMQELQQQSGK
jgi:import inner membrane translocase subunit TIM9